MFNQKQRKIESSSAKVLKLTQLSVLIAIEAVLAFVPILGSIPLGPMVATTAHLPVIIAGILMGPASGALMGFVFGLFSFIVHSFVLPTVTSFVFTPIIAVGDTQGNGFSLIICFVPRILLGIVAPLLFNLLKRWDEKGTWSYLVAGMGASIFHTILVLGGIYIFFKDSYAQAANVAVNLLLAAIGSVVLTNGIPEGILAAIAALAICKPLSMLIKRQRR